MTEVLDPPLVGPACAMLADLHRDLDALAGTDLTRLGDQELLDTAGELQRLRRRAEAAGLRWLHEVDARGVATARGASSTAAWLNSAHRLAPGAARRQVRQARRLFDDPAGPLVPPVEPAPGRHPALKAEFAAGGIGAEHVRAVTDTLDELPDTLDAPTRALAEAVLVDLARQHDPWALARLGKHLRHLLDPDGDDALAEDEQAQIDRRYLQIRSRKDGGADLRGRLDPELAALLHSQLNPLAAPRPAADGTRDLRSADKRNADALASLLRIVAGADGMPTRRGARPTVAVHLSLETLQGRPGSLAAGLDWAGPISAESARRLACDARIIPVVLAANGEPLDVGRASYTVTNAIWRALVARDGGCAFAGCDRPPEWCEGHHIVFWADGGETSVANTCLLCDHHHRVVHHEGWDIELIDGVIHVVPPAWIDPDRLPRRNTQRVSLAARATPPLFPTLDLGRPG